jgi:mono/diheme cytochrome c family protein
MEGILGGAFMRVRMLSSAIVVIILLSAGFVVAQQQSNVTINRVSAPPTSASSGKEMYESYCASCHGPAGEGNGPAAPALRVQPTDLAALAKHNGGKFPADHVATVLSGGGVTAHGSADMPVWGPVFRKLSLGSQAEVQLRIANLTKYLESLQSK